MLKAGNELQLLEASRQECVSSLKQLLGVQDLAAVTNVSVVLDKQIYVTLDGIGRELLQLQALRLDGSTLSRESCAHNNNQQQDAPLAVLAQARSGLSATLTVLAVSHCGLTSLQGVQLLVQLRELYAASNQLTDLGPLQGLGSLQLLDVSDNVIDDTDMLLYLAACCSLTSIKLYGNPLGSCSSSLTCKKQVQHLLPQVVYLDGYSITDNVSQENTSCNRNDLHLTRAPTQHNRDSSSSSSSSSSSGTFLLLQPPQQQQQQFCAGDHVSSLRLTQQSSSSGMEPYSLQVKGGLYASSGSDSPITKQGWCMKASRSNSRPGSSSSSSSYACGIAWQDKGSPSAAAVDTDLNDLELSSSIGRWSGSSSRPMSASLASDTVLQQAARPKLVSACNSCHRTAASSRSSSRPGTSSSMALLTSRPTSAGNPAECEQQQQPAPSLDHQAGKLEAQQAASSAFPAQQKAGMPDLSSGVGLYWRKMRLQGLQTENGNVMLSASTDAAVASDLLMPGASPATVACTRAAAPADTCSPGSGAAATSALSMSKAAATSNVNRTQNAVDVPAAAGASELTCTGSMTLGGSAVLGLRKSRQHQKYHAAVHL